MKRVARLVSVLVVLAMARGSTQSAPAGPNWTLWYRQPAAQWVEALPIGNGRLAAMMFGGVAEEHLQLNEDTLWAGGPYDPANPDALAALPEARRLVADRQYAEAHQLIAARMMAKPLREMPFQPLGDLRLTFPAPAAITDYRRELDLDAAVTRVMFTADGVTYTREFSGCPLIGAVPMNEPIPLDCQVAKQLIRNVAAGWKGPV